MYKNIIWDFDGTLFDTYPSIARALCRAVKAMGFEVSYEEAYALAKVSIGHAERVLAERFGIEAKEIRERKEFAYEDIMPEEASLFPRVRDILEEIVKRNHKNIIFTHRGNESTVRYLRAHNVEHLFTDVVSSKQGFALKPDPAGNLYIIEKHGLIKEETLAVGDREIDILAGHNAGVDSCLYVNPGELPEVEATYRIESFDRLYEILFANS